MSRKLATIQTIKELLPIEGADAIELAIFKDIGWKCVVKKGEFKPEDKAVYFEIDSLLPLRPEFEFLVRGSSPKKTTLEDGTVVEGYRLKSMRMKGQLSQGLALPVVTTLLSGKKYELLINPELTIPRLTITPDRVTIKFQNEDDLKQFEFTALGFVIDAISNNYINQSYRVRGPFDKEFITFLSGKGDKKIIAKNFFSSSDDLSEYLGVYKYEAPISIQLAGQVRGSFPSFIPKTDEERIQTCWDIVQKYKDVEWYASIKFDGSSCTMYKHGGCFGVCSRNLDLKETDGNSFWQIANKFDLKERLPEGYAIQGELIGEGIQKNPHKIKGIDFRVFNVYNILEGKYLDFQDAVEFVEKLGLGTNLKFVETINVGNDGTLNGKTLEGLLECADLTGLEGMVYRPIKEITDSKFGRVSFKVISNKYLLKND